MQMTEDRSQKRVEDMQQDVRRQFVVYFTERVKATDIVPVVHIAYKLPGICYNMAYTFFFSEKHFFFFFLLSCSSEIRLL